MYQLNINNYKISLDERSCLKIEIRKELKTGIVELAILALLQDREMYGYEIAQELSLRSAGQIKVKEGTLYPILYRLEEKGVITNYWQAPKNRGKPRKYYQMTPKGQEYYQHYQAEWLIISKFMNQLIK